jgi:beta-lactam-binding protein with PASTA domain
MKKFGYFLLIVIGLILLSGSLGYLLPLYLSPTPETKVPSVMGMPKETAIQTLQENGLNYKIDGDYGENGVVTYQKPEPGKWVKINRKVILAFENPLVIPAKTTSPETEGVN